MFYYAISLLAVAAIAILTASCGTRASEGTDRATVEPTENRSGEMLEVGATAPDFTVRDERGNEVILSAFRGEQNVVLIFYPANETPGCTAQLCAVRDEWDDFTAANVQVFGVNTANALSHRSFSENHNFPFPLLADTGGDIVRAYGCRGTLGVIKRTVYGINKDGQIVFAERGMPDTAQILAAFEEAGGSSG